MKKYTDEQLEANYQKFLAVVKKYFTGERLERLLFMYSMEELGPNLILSPASGNKWYHNAYDGGYVDHVLNVARNSLRMMQVFKDAGADIDFTTEELLFSALHHDLGKLGSKGKLGYLKNPSNWHVENQGKVYTSNPELTFMTATDRTFFLLSHYGISYSEKEYFGIKLTDGMYDEDNKKYLQSYNPDVSKRFLHSHITRILHFADAMSADIERMEFITSQNQ